MTVAVDAPFAVGVASDGQARELTSPLPEIVSSEDFDATSRYRILVVVAFARSICYPTKRLTLAAIWP